MTIPDQIASDLAGLYADGTAGVEAVTYTPPGGPPQTLYGSWENDDPMATGGIAGGSIQHHHEATFVVTVAQVAAIDRAGTITRDGVEWKILRVESTLGQTWTLWLTQQAGRSEAPRRLRA